MTTVRAATRSSTRSSRTSFSPWRSQPSRVRDTHREMSGESTTPDLVERWRRAAEAAYGGDLDSTMGIFAPDAVWEVQPLGISHRGAPAIRSFLEDWLGSYEKYEHHHEGG